MDMCEWMCLILCKCVSVWICHSALWLIECWVGAVHCYYSLTTVLGQKREKISLNPIRFLMLTLRIIYKCIQIDVYMLQHTHTIYRSDNISCVAKWTPPLPPVPLFVYLSERERMVRCLCSYSFTLLHHHLLCISSHRINKSATYIFYCLPPRFNYCRLTEKHELDQQQQQQPATSFCNAMPMGSARWHNALD